MSDPYLDLEAGAESSQPREFYKIVINGITAFYVASGGRDIVYNGDIYTAQPAARTDIVAATAGGEDGDTTIALPMAHAFVQRYLAQGTPPRQVVVTIYRQQGALVEQTLTGYVTSIAMNRHLATLTIRQRLARLLTRSLPVFNAGTRCPHVLFDGNCRAVRNNYTLGVSSSIVPVLTVTGFDGRLVTISSDGGVPNEWAQNGELVHLASGERMTILTQEGTIITMQAPISGMQVGDAITVCAGCAKDIVTCRVKFANQLNHGGFPQLPTKNPFTPTGIGAVEQK